MIHVRRYGQIREQCKCSIESSIVTVKVYVQCATTVLE